MTPTTDFQLELLELHRLLDALIRNIHSDPVQQFIRFYEILMSTPVIHWESGYVQMKGNKLILKIPEIGILGYWLLNKNQEPGPGFTRFPQLLTPECVQEIQQIFATENTQVRNVIITIINECQEANLQRTSK